MLQKLNLYMRHPILGLPDTILYPTFVGGGSAIQRRGTKAPYLSTYPFFLIPNCTPMLSGPGGILWCWQALEHLSQ